MTSSFVGSTKSAISSIAHSSTRNSNVTEHEQRSMRFAAHTARTRRPQRFRPAMIIIAVLSLGGLFIGLTMTVIAYWPGYSSIGGSPLRIVGPIILGLGGLVFIGVIVESCRKSNSETKQRRQKMQNPMIASQNAMRPQRPYGHSQTPRSTTPTSVVSSTIHKPQPDAAPSKGILKKAGSTSTYTGRSSDIESDSGGGLHHNHSNDSTGSGAQYVAHKISQLPDPVAARQQGRVPTGTDSQNTSYDSESSVPEPVRHSKNRNRSRGQNGAAPHAGATNMAYAQDDPRDVAPQRRELQPQERPRQFDVYAGRSNQAYVENEQQPKQPSRSRRPDDQHLEINIRAQPGTQVHIEPGAAAPPSQVRTPQAPGVYSQPAAAPKSPKSPTVHTAV